MLINKKINISQNTANAILQCFPMVTTKNTDELDRHLIAQIKFNNKNYLELNYSEIITAMKWLSSASEISPMANEILLQLYNS